MNDWALKLVDNKYFDSWKTLLETLSFIVTIFGAIAIIITCVQYYHDRRNRKEDSEFHKAELSVSILEKFSKDIIPDINDYYKKLDMEISKSKDDLKELDEEKRDEILLNLKLELNVIGIFNSLELISSYVRADIVNRDMIFDPLSNVTIRFINENIDAFEKVIKSSPYVNLRYVLDNWDKKKRIDFLNEQERIIEREKKELSK